jgi:hypothetical protein
LIRYQCPHCQHVCETSDVLRGFPVYCLSCRQPTRVPSESTFTGEMPAATPQGAPADANSMPRHQPVVASAPAVDSPKPPPSPHKPIEKPKPFVPPATTAVMAGRSSWMRPAVIGLIAVLVLAGGFFGWRWNSGRSAAKAELAAKQQDAARRQTISDNFDADAVHRLAAKLPKWDIALSPVPKLNGKLVVLSVTDATSAPAASDQDLIRELLEHGKFDELTFELPDSVWAEGIGELETIVGVRWNPEVAGVVKDGKIVEVTESRMTAEQKALPQVQRWHADVFILDLKSAKMTARKEFSGPLPTAPQPDKKASIGLRPIDEIVQWL